MGCQKNIADKIRAKGADYFLALKGNQRALLSDIASLFEAFSYSPDIYSEDDMGVRCSV